MKKTISLIFLPPLIGVIAIISLVILTSNMFGKGFEMHRGDIKFFTLFVLFLLCTSVIAQYTYQLRIWNRFFYEKKVWCLTHIQFIIIRSLIGGVTFSLLFTNIRFGFIEFLHTSAILSSVIFGYWVINLITTGVLTKTKLQYII